VVSNCARYFGAAPSATTILLFAGNGNRAKKHSPGAKPFSGGCGGLWKSENFSASRRLAWLARDITAITRFVLLNFIKPADWPFERGPIPRNIQNFDDVRFHGVASSRFYKHDACTRPYGQTIELSAPEF